MSKQPNRSLRKRLHDAFFPHAGNGFKPAVFTASGIAAVLIAVLFVQAAYFFHTNVVFKQTNFLASVLPGVLATLTNQDRAKNGIQELVTDSTLARAAQLKAEDMAAKGYFAHVDPEGHEPWYWLDRVGYEYGYAGENLAVKFTDSEDVEEAWMNSPTHRANIVKAQYTRIGIGVAQGRYKGEETTFVVQFFATPAQAPVAVAPEAPEVGLVQVSVPETEGEPAPAEAASTTDGDQVLGIEIGTVMPESPEEEPMLETTYQEQHPESQTFAEDVQQAPAEALSFAAQAATSPTDTLIYVLSALAAIFFVLLIIAISVHMRVQYLEVIGGGLLILLVILSLLAYNAMSDSSVQMPADEGAAIESI